MIKEENIMGCVTGWKLCRVDFEGEDRIKPCEEKDICIVLAKETRAVIHGVVKLHNGMPAHGAVVKLFKKKCDDPCDLEPVTFTFTDCCGQFMFGVTPCKDFVFVIKVFFFIPEKHEECKEFDCSKDCDKDCDNDRDCHKDRDCDKRHGKYSD
jgi:hypothetical protein